MPTARLAARLAFALFILNNSPMLPSRTSFAFIASAEMLFRKNERIYFWTFTFRQVPRNDVWAMWAWKRFMQAFQKEFPLHKGVRVCELHKSHGIHFHALITARIPIRRLQALAYPFGFGVMWVDTCDEGTANYLAKYLTKSYREENHFDRGRRRWGAIGGFKPCRNKDVVYETEQTKNHQKLYGKKQITFAQAILLGGYTKMWGELSDWPESIRKQYEAAFASDIYTRTGNKSKQSPSKMDRAESKPRCVLSGGVGSGVVNYELRPRNFFRGHETKLALVAQR